MTLFLSLGIAGNSPRRHEAHEENIKLFKARPGIIKTIQTIVHAKAAKIRQGRKGEKKEKIFFAIFALLCALCVNDSC
jgi:hypothetical protein